MKAKCASATDTLSGGYIVMVVMEDLDPVDGSVLGGTITMVEIEDVASATAADSRNASIVPQTGMDVAAVGMFLHRLRRRALLHERRQPRTNIPLENALKALRRVDLDAVVAASDTIQKFTKDSRECCARCIEVPASQLIYNVLVRMSCQSSDPTVLRNLLLSLGNLAKYRRWKQQTRQRVTRFERSNARRQLDSRLIDILGEMLLVLSDDLDLHQQQSWSLFTIASGTLWDLVMLVQCDVRSNTRADESWIGTRQRLIDLRDRLLAKEPVTTMTAKNHAEQEDLLGGYLASAAAILARISSVM
ncbi:Hypothetical protein PHPALM_15619 [Phytophthora palmivora]|uniref:Uncharacterized protein n=1 Tax=Phytophthora palmivora TaxID=4796 RepID=A0A2P4XRP9_9STRA|nr:Hypothetical protein PHPALM_15619 [Phytophthora palmivora]